MSTNLPDFDTLKKMATDDATGLEQLRRRIIEETIAAAPPENHQRLRALQWRIDVERQRAANPLAACIRLSSMLQGSLHQLAAAFEDPASVRRNAADGAVLRFPQPGRRGS